MKGASGAILNECGGSFPFCTVRGACSDFLLKSLHTAGSIDELLLAGVEWMAVATNFHLNFLQRGASFERVATGARHCRLIICGMDILFHTP